MINLDTALPLPCPMSMEWVPTSSLHHISLCSQLMGEEPQRSCYLVSLCDFLPFLSLPKANMSGPFMGCVTGLAHPSEAVLCLGLCYTQ